MDPLISNGVDPGLMRVTEKRGHERELSPRRRRPLPPPEGKNEESENEAGQEPDSPNPDSPNHAVDDLA